MPESFEEHQKALEEAVRALESGEHDLGRSLEIYEGAVVHLKACHEILAKAEARVKILTEGAEKDFEEPDRSGA